MINIQWNKEVARKSNGRTILNFYDLSTPICLQQLVMSVAIFAMVSNDIFPNQIASLEWFRTLKKAKCIQVLEKYKSMGVTKTLRAPYKIIKNVEERFNENRLVTNGER